MTTPRLSVPTSDTAPEGPKMDFRRPYSVEREALVYEEQRGAERRAVLALVAKPCAHDGDVSVHITYRDLSDHETCYGRCLGCKQWVRRETWFGRDRESAVETDLMSARELESLDVVEGKFWSADQ